MFVSIIFAFPYIPCAEENVGSVDYKAGFYYTVQKGDTLWDLSETFSDSPWVWPDLWNENKQIANPHWIYPGERIRLYHRNWKDMFKEQAPVEVKPYFYYPGIARVGFIRKEAVKSSGTIFKIKDKEMISAGDLIYISQEGDVLLPPGGKYTIYRTSKPVKDKETKEYIGIQHYILGVAEIIQNDEQGFCLARVIQSFRPIAVDDHVMPYEKKWPEITIADSLKGIDGKIIKSEDSEVIFAADDIAFINKGKTDGITPGQMYSVYYQDKDKINGKQVVLPPVEYGKLVVLRTEETTSTVLITDSDKIVEDGAKFHFPVAAK